MYTILRVTIIHIHKYLYAGIVEITNLVGMVVSYSKQLTPNALVTACSSPTVFTGSIIIVSVGSDSFLVSHLKHK